MPPMVRRKQPVPPQDDPEKRVRMARELFRSRFRRSGKGNLWRPYEEVTVTVFPSPRGDGTYCWCIAGAGGGRQYGNGFATEDDAIDGLASELRVGAGELLPDEPEGDL